MISNKLRILQGGVLEKMRIDRDQDGMQRWHENMQNRLIASQESVIQCSLFRECKESSHSARFTR